MASAVLGGGGRVRSERVRTGKNAERLGIGMGENAERLGIIAGSITENLEYGTWVVDFNVTPSGITWLTSTLAITQYSHSRLPSGSDATPQQLVVNDR